MNGLFLGVSPKLHGLPGKTPCRGHKIENAGIVTVAPGEKEDTVQYTNKNKKRVSTDGIDCTDAHTPSFSVSIAPGHSCSG